MRIVKKELKEAIASIKRFVKDKENGKILIQSDDGQTIKIQAHTPQLISFHVLQNPDGEIFSFFCNPYHVETLLKGKGVEIDLTLTDEKWIRDELSIPITPTLPKKMMIFSNLVPFKNETLFLSALKEAESKLFESEKPCTSYIKIKSTSAQTAEEKQIHYFRLEEEFLFNEGFIHQSVATTLSKQLKGPLKHGIFKGAFVIADNDKDFYLIKISNNAYFPSLKKMVEKMKETMKPVSSFVVDAHVFNDIAKTYKKKVTEIEFTEKDGYLLVDPKNEEFEIEKIPLQNQKGKIEPSIFAADVAKGLFQGHNKPIKVEHFLFQNLYGEEGYMWRILTTDTISMVGGITERWKKAKTNYEQKEAN